MIADHQRNIGTVADAGRGRSRNRAELLAGQRLLRLRHITQNRQRQNYDKRQETRPDDQSQSPNAFIEKLSGCACNMHARRSPDWQLLEDERVSFRYGHVNRPDTADDGFTVYVIRFRTENLLLRNVHQKWRPSLQWARHQNATGSSAGGAGAKPLALLIYPAPSQSPPHRSARAMHRSPPAGLCAAAPRGRPDRRRRHRPAGPARRRRCRSAGTRCRRPRGRAGWRAASNSVSGKAEGWARRVVRVRLAKRAGFQFQNNAGGGKGFFAQAGGQPLGQPPEMALEIGAVGQIVMEGGLGADRTGETDRIDGSRPLPLGAAHQRWPVIPEQGGAPRGRSATAIA